MQSQPPSWQADGGTSIPFSQSHFLTALCSSTPFNIPVVKLFSFTSPRLVVSHPFGRHPCCKVLRGQHAAGACVRFRGIVLQCFYWWSQANSLTYVLSFDQRFSKSGCVKWMFVSWPQQGGGNCYVCADGRLIRVYLSLLSKHFLYNSVCLHWMKKTVFSSCYTGAWAKKADTISLELYIHPNTSPTVKSQH